MAFNFSPKTVTEGLVLALDAANPRSYVSGSTVWRDLTANNYSGSLVNGPTFNSSNGGSIGFDGANDYADLPNIGVSNLSQFSVSFWAKKSSATANSTVYSEGTPASWPGNLFVFYFGTSENSGKCRVYFGYPNSSPDQGSVLIGTTNVANGNWYYVTYNQTNTSNRKLYVNTIVEATNTTNIISTATNSYIGTNNNKGTLAQFGNMNLANLTCYNRSLSDSEILQNYNALKGRFGLT